MAEVISQTRCGHITGIGPTIPLHARSTPSQPGASSSISPSANDVKIEAMERRMARYGDYWIKMFEYL